MGDEHCIRYSLCRVPTSSNIKEIAMNSSLFPDFFSLPQRCVWCMCLLEFLVFPPGFRSFISNSLMKVRQKTVSIKVGPSIW